jgi:hypothetical protein
MKPMGVDFLVMNLIGALAVLQIAAARGDLRGMMFLPSKRVTAALGFLALAGAFAWFFASEPRNYADDAGGLNGNEDAGLFCLACVLAIAFTLLSTSAINWKLGRDKTSHPGGIEALRETTFLRAFCGAVRRLWTRS